MQCLSQSKDSKLFINLYVAGPNEIKMEYALDLQPNQKISAIGPFGLKIEYLVTKTIGIGLHGNASMAELNEDNELRTFNKVTLNTDYTKYQDLVKWRFVRLLPTLTKHFGNFKKFDPYCSVALGYSQRRVEKYYGLTNNQEEFIRPLPIGGRVELGCRYHFNKFVGLEGFLGIGGGAVLGLGVLAKF